MNRITRFAGCVAALGLLSTVGTCNQAAAQVLPQNPGIQWDHPTLNQDGSAIDGDLKHFRMKFQPLDGQLPYHWYFANYGIEPAADANGQQRVEWETTGPPGATVAGLHSRFLTEAQRCDCSLFGAWRVEMWSVDFNGNASTDNPTIDIEYINPNGDQLAPGAPQNVTAINARVSQKRKTEQEKRPIP